MNDILFISFTTDYSAPFKGDSRFKKFNPTQQIKNVSEGYGYKFHEKQFENVSELRDFLKNEKTPYDLIYLASHGDAKGIRIYDEKTRDDKFEHYRWADLAFNFCESAAVSEDTIFYMGCCFGGYKRTSLILMANCPKITHVAGLPCPLRIVDSPLAFNVFLHNVVLFNDSERVNKKITDLIGVQFNHYCKYNLDAELLQVWNSSYLPDEYFTLEQLKEQSRQTSEDLNKPIEVIDTAA